MRFKISMINSLSNYHEVTIITNNEMSSKKTSQRFNPKSKILEDKYVSK